MTDDAGDTLRALLPVAPCGRSRQAIRRIATGA